MAGLDSNLQALVLGGAEWYTRDEMASMSRMPLTEVRRLWRAMGFPDVGEARAFTDADLSALLRVAALVERGTMDMDAMVDVARSLGQTTARLADWQVDAIGRQLVESDPAVPLKSSDLAELGDEVSDLLPELEQLLVYVWRRQMAAAIGRSVTVESTDEHEHPTTTATVGFADLVSFTRLSRQLDGADLGALVSAFETTSADIVHAESARLVKTLGDEVMFVCDSPQCAARIALALHETHGRNELVPEIRVGLATGVVINRMGDVYGSTVNRASRNTAVAKPGSTVLDSTTSEALQSGDDPKRFHIKALAPRPMRGFGIVRPFVLSGQSSD